MNKNTAIIFGISGQDGAYLAHHLLKKKYNVFGITRNKKKISLINLLKLKIKRKVKIRSLRFPNQNKIDKLISSINPTEIYYLAGQSSVSLSFKKPVETYISNNLNLFYLLEFLRRSKKNISLYNSASSECFGNNNKVKCNEKTVFNPISPYGKAKSFSFWITKYYRENFKIKASNGILFNHESPLRKKIFVTQKVANYAQNFEKNTKKKLVLGNVKVRRDWGWAPEYVKVIHLINSQKKNDDYVIGSGKNYSLLEYIKIIFNNKNIPLKMLKIAKKFYRPKEIIKISADNRKIIKEFRWKPTSNINTIALKMLKRELF